MMIMYTYNIAVMYIIVPRYEACKVDIGKKVVFAYSILLPPCDFKISPGYWRLLKSFLTHPLQCLPVSWG